MDSDKLIKVHIDIAKIHMLYCFLLILYLLWSKFSMKEMNKLLLFCFIFAILLTVVDYLYAVKKYYNNFKIVRVIRSLMAVCSSVMLVSGTNLFYVISIATLLFLVLVIQVTYLTSIQRFRNKIIVFFFIYIPMFVVSCIRIYQTSQTNFTIRTIIFNQVLVSAMLISITLISHIFAENTIERRKLTSELIKMKQNTNQVSNENTYERLARENSEMLIENLIQQYISSSLDISNLMKLILESLSEALVVNLCSIIVKSEDDKTYQYDTRYICNGFNIELFNSYIENGSLIEQFKDLNEPFINNQVDSKEYDFLEGTTVKSLLIYPLMNEAEWLGILVIGKDMNDYFLENMSFFERVSTQFSIALTNARTYTKMEDMAMKDGLTGIYNRSFMINKINEHISDVVLNKSSLAILLFDIDKFKNVNDEYGHLFGDEVIRVCANITKETAEKYNGFAARYGGEEFVIVCKEESLEELHNIANGLHNQIKQTKVSYRGSSLWVNVSIGVAAYPATCNNPAELIDRADKAMYHSKKIGRACVTFDGEYEIE